MGLAKARRIASDAHRGRLYVGGGTFAAHLERVEATVEETGGDAIAAQAAWLYDVPVDDLLNRGVPWPVVRVVRAVRFGDEPAERFVDRIIGHRRAAVVWSAILTDLHRHFAGQTRYEWWRAPHARLAGAWGLPVPAALVDGTRKGLAELLAAYEQRSETALQSEIFAAAAAPANAGTPPVEALIARWWDSADPWEQLVAVWARAAVPDRTHRGALLRKVSSPDPRVAARAIYGLTGAADAEEIRRLRDVVTTPDRDWRWARGSAARRLVAIGGAAAEAALDDQPLVPLDPPWREDRDWLRRNGAAAIPRLVAYLDDPLWSQEAPYALGELRALEAVGRLCELAPRYSYPVAFVEALGKIGSADAVPTLVRLAREHDYFDVRDHALRALDRIDDPRVADAAAEAGADPDPVVRDRAARVLARHGDDRAVLALIRLCDGPHAARAAVALARIGDARALPTLWRLFREAPDRPTRYAAGRGLARIQGRREYASSVDNKVWRAYMWLCGHKPEWQSTRELVAALRNADPMVRARAIEALARLGDVDLADHARPLLDDPDPRVRATASGVLRRLTRASG